MTEELWRNREIQRVRVTGFLNTRVLVELGQREIENPRCLLTNQISEPGTNSGGLTVHVVE